MSRLALLGCLLSAAIVARSQFFSVPANGDLRLTNDANANSNVNASKGFLEIYYNGSWGTICYNESFDFNTSKTACQQLGYVGPNAPARGEISVDFFDTGSGMSNVPVQLTDVHCSQPELHLLRCSISMDVSTYCAEHHNDVYLDCNSSLLTKEPYFGQIMLSNTETPYRSQGLLMIFLNQEWGTVCNISFHSLVPADSVCQQLGYTNALSYEISPVVGSGIIWLNDASNCTEPQPCFRYCYRAPSLRDITCNHIADLAVYCTFDTAFNQTRQSGSMDSCMIKVLEVPSELVAFLTVIFSTIIALYVTGFVVRCIVAFYHNTDAYREKTMRTGEVERRRFVTIHNSLTESEVQSPVSDSLTPDSNSTSTVQL